jgi:hypothetical protein
VDQDSARVVRKGHKNTARRFAVPSPTGSLVRRTLLLGVTSCHQPTKRRPLHSAPQRVEMPTEMIIEDFTVGVWMRL